MEECCILNTLIEDYRRRKYFPQASFAVFDRKGILCQGSCGEGDKDTAYDLASLTKVFTGTVLLRLIQKGALSLLDSPLSFLNVPRDCPLFRDLLGRITVCSLLTHTSGLPAWYPFYATAGDFFHITERILETYVPERRMVYSDLNFILVGMLVSRLSGKDLPGAVQEWIAEPMGCKRLFYLPRGEKAREENLAVSCCGNGIEEQMCRERGIVFDGFRDPALPVRGEANDGNAWYFFGGVSGHAGLFGDAGALAALGRFYLNAGEGLFAEAQKDHGFERGLIFELGDKYPEGCGHTGFTGTSLYLSRENGVGAVLLTNRLAFADGERVKDLSCCRREFHQMVLSLAKSRTEGREERP